MALNIKDPETDRLARELADVSGPTITEALRTALTHELAAARTRATRRMVVESRVELDGTRDLELLIETANVTLVPYNGDHAIAAHDAWRRFGKGRQPGRPQFR